MSFGLSGIIPAIHYVLMEGWISKVSQASLGWLILMGLLYILGALFYALRVPERWFPGKCDIWVSIVSFLSVVSQTVKQNSFSVPIASNFPRAGAGGRLRALPRNQ